MKQFIMAFTLACICPLILFSCGKNSDGTGKRVMRLASVLPEDHPTSQSLAFFAQRLAEVSNNQIDVQLFLNSQLGKEVETIEMCQAGTIEVVAISVAPLTQFVPELNALSMPFIFRDSEHAYSVVDGPVGAELSKDINAVDLQPLCYFDSGSRNIMTKKGPVQRPEDLNGQKIRVMSAPLMVETINALGASAVPMNQGEVYTALQTGVLDGWENNPPTTLTFKMYETGCLYYARTEHLMVPDLLVISLSVYQGLDETTRSYVDQVARETTQKQRELWKIAQQETVEKLIAAGMHFNDVDKALFSARVEDLYLRMYQKYGDGYKSLCERIKQHP